MTPPGDHRFKRLQPMRPHQQKQCSWRQLTFKHSLAQKMTLTPSCKWLVGKFLGNKLQVVAHCKVLYIYPHHISVFLTVCTIHSFHKGWGNGILFRPLNTLLIILANFQWSHFRWTSSCLGTPSVHAPSDLHRKHVLQSSCGSTQ